MNQWNIDVRKEVYRCERCGRAARRDAIQVNAEGEIYCKRNECLMAFANKEVTKIMALAQ